VLCAFDLIKLDGEDLRGARLENRKGTLAGLLRGTDDGIAFNKHFEGDGAIVFRHACALGCEGILSKRLGSAYRSGRVDHWLKIKNPAAPVVRREAEEDWSGKRATGVRNIPAGALSAAVEPQHSRSIYLSCGFASSAGSGA
jgi:hypothetical protein